MFTGNVVGNVGNDPEMRYSAGGEPVLRFNLASNYGKRNAEGAWENRVEWVRIVVFGKRAESLTEHDLIRKGVRLYVYGKVEASPWLREGVAQAGLQIIAQEIEVMGARDENAGGNSDRGWGNDMTGQPSRPRAGAAPAADDGDLEDLPF